MARLQTSSVLRFLPMTRTVSRTRCSVSIKNNQQHRLYAHQSYGGGQGDPKGENPQDQGANPSAGKEHPGPPPPAEGQGSGGGPTKGHGSGHNTQQGSSASGHGTNKDSGNSPQPKILNEGVPAVESKEVKEHNEDMTRRHDRADTNADDSKDQYVDKKFWSGIDDSSISFLRQRKLIVARARGS